MPDGLKCMGRRPETSVTLANRNNIGQAGGRSLPATIPAMAGNSIHTTVRSRPSGGHVTSSAATSSRSGFSDPAQDALGRQHVELSRLDDDLALVSL